METTDSAIGATLDDISTCLDSVQGAVQPLACDVDEGARQSEAWTIHDALWAVRSDVQDLRDEAAE
jgi:hypothetical protein